MREISCWQMTQVSRPMSPAKLPMNSPAQDEALVRVVGCGVCHTDLGFFYEGIRTAKPPPLTLGHEISGIVEEAGANFRKLLGKAVIVPAVLPCGECDLCRKGRGTICRQQKMPGNHIDGGFASHVIVPARFLCEVSVPDESSPFGNSGVTLRELAVVADAVTTPYQAIKNSGLAKDDFAIFIGGGGIGGFGVQIAKALGATVVAIDIDDRKLTLLSQYGADLTLNPQALDKKAIRQSLQNFVKEKSLSPYEWKIFETSGTKAGQELAFGLLTHGATLSVVGFTMDTLELRLSNLMAFDARALGNWGCDPKYYPEVLALVQQGKIQLAPFVQTFPLSEINSVFERVHRRELDKRPVLVPDFQ
ncbi:MAG: 6-hydroxycyclohex-1-ene-1-carbonyl-CoA dehydrogenase [candidate division KSB1 bacterium]|nr:6-hydroxycyclohex-1-ene-1-carbonyl-CoA dehydrogenase [candidate division KSB1 bacterium]MDZ7368117.1 6-hydroxycyclohex-1-ene-1-carbonyl-CoA dehydrogenase [candidate division KSB1 bacterium]MDZ7405796.1 6-hydroxycyclohex-1-ene-1-carbonyl-CoA dehydrogenase [candidate division KSB1 bacterium]